VFWIRNTLDENNTSAWSEYFAMLTPAKREWALANMAPGTRGHELHPALKVEPEDAIVNKYRFSAFVQGASDLPERLRAQGYDHRSHHRHRDQRVLRVLGARRHDAQLQDRHGERRQCRAHGCRAQRHALRASTPFSAMS
jgi:Isochorismatase family